MRDIIEKFVNYASKLNGDEKGEAQVFCDRLFQAFGHEGYKEAGATLEFRVKSKKSTQFADLLWEDRVLLEMKKKGSKLQSHRSQIFNYWWNLRPSQPKYSILCNFSEFIIYDFSIQDEPLDIIKIEDLPDRFTAFNFMLPKATSPVFNNNLEEATRETADLVAKVFNSLIDRNVERERAQRFVLQCIFTMFAEDYQLLPKDMFTQILLDCKVGNGNIYDMLHSLFQQMDSKQRANGGRFKDVAYFNGGLFSVSDPIDLAANEIEDLHQAATKRWNKVNPAIFGTIFQSSMGAKARHAFGAHFTTELDILKIVYPCIIQPWREKINKANTLFEMKQLRKEIAEYKVLDPACGSGNFLYVAFRELKRIEMELLNKIHIDFPKSAGEIGTQSIVSIKQFYGIDFNTFAVELAKVTLMLAKEISIKETRDWVNTMQIGMGFQLEDTLPLDNMDQNIVFGDALYTTWIEADTIIGNPPYQSKRNMQREFGANYINILRENYNLVPGRADYCVYWFYKAHNSLKQNGYAGLVGTNTITQNYSREGSLEYILNNGGTIFNAVASQPWSGDAVVFVSIVNWKKGEYDLKKKLYIEDENHNQIEFIVENINSSLTNEIDLSKAEALKCNRKPKVVFQGQVPGQEGFVVEANIARELIRKNPYLKGVLKPQLIGRELMSIFECQPQKYIIDFTGLDVFEASKFKELFDIVSRDVKSARKEMAEKQEKENAEILKRNPRASLNNHHIGFFNKWWQLSYGREDMLEKFSSLKRYIVCPQLTSRPVFEFIDSQIIPNATLIAFAFEDDFTFGILQSSLHINWWKEKCSTFKGDYRYTANTVWDTFPFPQSPTLNDVKKIANCAKKLRERRKEIMHKHNYTLRDIYRILEEPGANPLKELHDELDNAVISSYNFSRRKNLLAQLLDLNLDIAIKILNNQKVHGPGLPTFVKNNNDFISDDCISIQIS
jgi:hypothetical protein